MGNLFDQKANIVIGMNDVFDTKIGEIIKSNSIQGQFLSIIYKNNYKKLDKDINSSLLLKSGTKDINKTRGKNIRYPIGTILTLEVGKKKFFCVAYSRMGSNLKAQSNISKLTLSIEKLWEEIRIRGQGEKVAMAVIGSDLARIATATQSNIIKLIVSSFILASREAPITKELTVVIHSKNIEKINMLELNEFLQYF
jgi:hypothetical protein